MLTFGGHQSVKRAHLPSCRDFPSPQATAEHLWGMGWGCRPRPHSRGGPGRPCSNMLFRKLVELVGLCLVCVRHKHTASVIDASLLFATVGFRMKLYLVENEAFLKSPRGIFSLCANSPFVQRELCGFLADTVGNTSVNSIHSCEAETCTALQHSPGNWSLHTVLRVVFGSQVI